MAQSRSGMLPQEGTGPEFSGPESSGPDATGKPCPICKAPGKTRFKPFCSRRCADADLLRWLSGSYVIPDGAVDADEDGDDSKAQWDARQGDGQPRSNTVGKPSGNDLD